MSAATVMVPEFEPDAGVALSQVPPFSVDTDVVQVNGDPLLLEILVVWLGGFPAPNKALKPTVAWHDSCGLEPVEIPSQRRSAPTEQPVLDRRNRATLFFAAPKPQRKGYQMGAAKNRAAPAA